MAGGLFPPALNNIPVNQVAIDTYQLVWRFRRRIAYWSIAPFILWSIFWIATDKLYFSDLAKVSFILNYGLSLSFTILEVLVTVPFQVAIHRLAYPGFDFDQASYGPPLNVVNKYYFLYSIITVVIPIVVLDIINYISYIGNFYILYLFFLLIYTFFVFSFVLIFPVSALGIMSSLVGAWWLLRGNLLRLTLCVILTAGPTCLLSLILLFLPDYSGPYALIYEVVYAAISIALTLLTLGLWACCVSLCYYHVTNRQPLVSGMTQDSGEA